jgi:hypothetical protein
VSVELGMLIVLGRIGRGGAVVGVGFGAAVCLVAVTPLWQSCPVRMPADMPAKTLRKFSDKSKPKKGRRGCCCVPSQPSSPSSETRTRSWTPWGWDDLQ